MDSKDPLRPQTRPQSEPSSPLGGHSGTHPAAKANKVVPDCPTSIPIEDQLNALLAYVVENGLVATEIFEDGADLVGAPAHDRLEQGHYGYQRVRGRSDTFYTSQIVPEQAEIVKRVFEERTARRPKQKPK